MRKAVLSITLLLLFLHTSAALAKTIIIDGDGSEWIPAEMIIADGDDAAISHESLDLDMVYFTNSTTAAYFRVDMMGHYNPNYTIIICVDVEGTATTAGCAPSVGYEYAIAIDPRANCEATLAVADPLFLMDFQTLDVMTPPSLERVSRYEVTEVAVGLADLGITGDGDIVVSIGVGQTCNPGLFMDGGFGKARVGAGSPTAVTLTTTAAQNSHQTHFLIVIIFLLALLTAVAVYRQSYLRN